MLGIQEIGQRLYQIASQIHILRDYFDLISLVEPKYHRQTIIQTEQFHANLIGFVHIVGLQIGGQQKILK